MTLHNFEAEMSVLGSAILDTRAMVAMVAQLEAEDFYRPAHQVIFSAMSTMVKRGDPSDFVILLSELTNQGKLADVGGQDYLLEVAQYVPSPANLDRYAAIVKDLAMRRALESFSRAANAITHDTDVNSATDALAAIQTALMGISKTGGKRKSSSLSQIVRNIATETERYIDGRKVPVQVPTGFPRLNYMLCGFEPGDLVIIGARPSVGKTALAFNIADAAARSFEDSGKTILFFSLEMSESQIGYRFLTWVSHIPMRSMKDPNMTPDTYRAMMDASEILDSYRMIVNDESLTAQHIRSHALNVHQDTPLGLIIIDYLQLIRASDPKQSRVYQIGEMTKTLKNIAKDLNIPVVCLAQLARPDKNTDRPPTMTDLRDSGEIEQDADKIILLTRESYAKPTKEQPETDSGMLIVAKNRNGATGYVDVAFIGASAKWIPA